MDEQKTSSDSHNSLFKRILYALGVTKPPDTTEDLEQEIQELIEEGEEHGLISRQEGEMISSIFDFRETLIREIMTPSSDIISASSTAPVCEIIDLIKKNGFSRIPIYSENPDHIIGILHAKDLLICGASESLISLKSMVKPVFFAQENQKITTLLRDFQAKNTHMAIVTDEFGSIRGLITLEDVLEEIVGEIEDESDKPEEQWHLIDEHTLITSGKVNLEEIEIFFHITLPDGPYESVAGFIIDKFDRVPETGAETVFQSLTFTVLSANRRRIETVKIHQDVSGLT